MSIFGDMKIIITSATVLEIQDLKTLVEKSSLKNIHFHISGVGMLQSCFSIQKMMREEKPDIVVQVGIAGTYLLHHALGKVVVVAREMLGSCGVSEAEGWKDIFDLNLCNKENTPFKNGGLENPFLGKYNLLSLSEVTAITIDEITTEKSRINLIKEKYYPSLESMEGASLHYCGLMMHIPFIQIRGISNYVGERNKRNWKIPAALTNVNEAAFELLQKLQLG